MIVFRNDSSFPFLKIAREAGVPYAKVLRIADQLDGKDVSEPVVPDELVVKVSRAMAAERERRAKVTA
jgi:hypothetical protein